MELHPGRVEIHIFVKKADFLRPLLREFIFSCKFLIRRGVEST